MKLLMVRSCFASVFALGLLACGSDNGGTGPGNNAATFTITQGNNQTATVGTVAPVLPTLKVTKGGVPVAGATVVFHVTAGTGSVSSTPVVSSANGLVQARWTFGRAAGPQQVKVWNKNTGSGDSTLVATFDGTARHDSAARIIVTSGNGQSGAPGTRLAQPVVLQVVDQYGNGIPQKTVALSANQGGDIAPHSAVTDSTGHATVYWTLGTTSAQAVSVTNLGAVTVAGLPTLTLTALAHTGGATSPISFAIGSRPPVGGYVGDTLVFTSIGIQSQFQLASVVAAAGSMNTALIFSPTVGWTGALLISSLPHGPFTVAVTATDVNGNVKTVIANYVHDLPPRLAVASPTQPDGLVSPDLHVTATCTDDVPTACKSLFLYYGNTGTVLASGTSSIDQTISLASYEGSPVLLRFVAKDAVGQETDQRLRVNVSSFDHLTDLRTVSGIVFDADATRVLFVNTNAGTINVIQGGMTTQVGTLPDRLAEKAFLTPNGAIFESHGADRIIDVSGGTTTDLGVVSPGAFLMVNGTYAAWNNYQTVTRRDLTAGTNTTVTTTAYGGFNLGAGGFVAWNGGVSPYQIFKFQGGVNTQVTNGTQQYGYPLTDGINIAYYIPASPGSQLVLDSAGTQILLGTPFTSTNANIPTMMNNGWTAFPSPGTAGEFQLFVRSPDGTIQQVSHFGTTSIVEALGSAGEIVYTTGTKYYNGKRYASRPPYTTSTLIDGSIGQVIYHDGQFFLMVDNNVARLTF